MRLDRHVEGSEGAGVLMKRNQDERRHGVEEKEDQLVPGQGGRTCAMYDIDTNKLRSW